MKLFHASLWMLAPLLVTVDGAATTLFDGQQANIFPSDVSPSCLSAFNTTLNCDESVQLLWKQTDWAGWNATSLASLCASPCLSSLESLKATVAPACGTWSARLGLSSLDASKIVDTFLYRYKLACLNDAGIFCLAQLQEWDIPSMTAITWPTHTVKTYPDWNSECQFLTTYVRLS